jgi:hypothetical protein
VEGGGGLSALGLSSHASDTPEQRKEYARLRIAYTRAVKRGAISCAHAEQLTRRLFASRPSAVWGADWDTAIAKSGQSRLPNGWLPVGPLAVMVDARGGLAALGMFERRSDSRARRQEYKRLTRAYYRALERGALSYAHADELAIRLFAEHPCAIWGVDAWYAATEQPAPSPRRATAGRRGLTVLAA